MNPNNAFCVILITAFLTYFVPAKKSVPGSAWVERTRAKALIFSGCLDYYINLLSILEIDRPGFDANYIYFELPYAVVRPTHNLKLEKGDAILIRENRVIRVWSGIDFMRLRDYHGDIWHTMWQTVGLS